MSIPILEACRKRRRKPKMFDFHAFGDPGCPICPDGPFRDNIRIFLRECAEAEDYDVEGMPIWCSLLVIGKNGVVVPLYTVEENVNYSAQPFCNHCRCTGWSGNFVSKRKYHLIIPIDGEWKNRLEDGVFEVQTHLLHGLIHSNGFGHLLCINGIEGGSKYLCGREIMDLWDRICTNLRARRISVEDISKKRGMDLRLLYGIAYGHSWFGRWGYNFCRGSFGVTENHYTRAVEMLSSLELDKIIEDFDDIGQSKEMSQIIRYYRDLSQTPLITLRDILRFTLNVKSCPCSQKKKSVATTPKPSIRTELQKKPNAREKCLKYKKFSSLVGSMDSRWPTRRLEYAAEVIVDTLREKKADKFSEGGMTRQDVRDAARMHIGDTGLLDYVLKSMNNVIVGSHVVRRSVNPRTRILEYSIDEIGDRVSPITVTEPEPKIVPQSLSLSLVPGADVYSDVVYLYMHILLNYPESELVELATQAILDSKHFVKKWPFRDEADQTLRFICKVMPISTTVENKYGESPPGEMVILPLHATAAELKHAAQSALRETYCMLEKFVVMEIEKLEELEDEDLLFGAIESGTELSVIGSGVDLSTQLRYEGGPESWMVRCECGAKDDDGERMVACDICEVWQHTRCNGIEDTEAVPPLFVCPKCCSSLALPTSEAHGDFEESGMLLMIPSAQYAAELLC